LLHLAEVGEAGKTERVARLGAAMDLLKLRTAASSEAEKTRANLADTYVTHLAPLEAAGTLPAGTVATMLDKAGFPEYSQALGDIRQKTIQQKAGALRATLPALVKAGQLDKALTGIDPDIRAALQPDIEKLSAPATAPTAAYPPGYMPGLSLKHAPIDLVNALSATANKTVVPAFNVINSLLGMAPLPAVKPLPRDYSQIDWTTLNQ
jgi:hypothetical protein